jgi:hypothetical protein
MTTSSAITKIEEVTRTLPCPDCNGSGIEEIEGGLIARTCRRCKGARTISLSLEELEACAAEVSQAMTEASNDIPDVREQISDGATKEHPAVPTAEETERVMEELRNHYCPGCINAHRPADAAEYCETCERSFKDATTFAQDRPSGYRTQADLEAVRKQRSEAARKAAATRAANKEKGK